MFYIEDSYIAEKLKVYLLFSKKLKAIHVKFYQIRSSHHNQHASYYHCVNQR